jgi:hypothetical protein
MSAFKVGDKVRATGSERCFVRDAGLDPDKGVVRAVREDGSLDVWYPPSEPNGDVFKATVAHDVELVETTTGGGDGFAAHTTPVDDDEDDFLPLASPVEEDDYIDDEEFDDDDYLDEDEEDDEFDTPLIAPPPSRGFADTTTPVDGLED